MNIEGEIVAMLHEYGADIGLGDSVELIHEDSCDIPPRVLVKRGIHLTVKYARLGHTIFVVIDGKGNWATMDYVGDNS
jgi:hypothetical protein